VGGGERGQGKRSGKPSEALGRKTEASQQQKTGNVSKKEEKGVLWEFKGRKKKKGNAGEEEKQPVLVSQKHGGRVLWKTVGKNEDAGTGSHERKKIREGIAGKKKR